MPIFLVVGLIYFSYLSAFNQPKLEILKRKDMGIDRLGKYFLVEYMWVAGLLFLGLFYVLIFYAVLKQGIQ